MSDRRAEVAIVGAGIVGLAHAYHFARAGRRVLVLERDPHAVGASIRNFGMVWVVGQPLGELRDVALRSRQHWLDLLRTSGTWHRECGALHLAHAEDELQVMREFVEMAGDADVARMISPEEAIARQPRVRSESLLGAMASETELCVDPRITVARFAQHLAEHYGVQFEFGANVQAVEPGEIVTSQGTIRADQIVVAAGPEIGRLYPHLMVEAGLRLSHLQMLRLRADLPFGPHLCAGLTLLHYGNFRDCPSLPKLRERFAQTHPGEVEHGIHILVSHHGDGTLTVGDSHDYGPTPPPYRSEEVDHLILANLNRFVRLEDAAVIERWQGTYPTHSELPYFHRRIAPGLNVVACFGTGMTLSFGVAERVVNEETE